MKNRNGHNLWLRAASLSVGGAIAAGLALVMGQGLLYIILMVSP